jgi:hypothetical protein
MYPFSTMSLFSYLFWPNPGIVSYGHPTVIFLLFLCGGLVLLSLGIKLLRGRSRNSVTRKLSRSWSTAAFSFGLLGLVLTLSRAEGVQFVSMRFWWFVWGSALLGYVLFQCWQFRTRHYTVLPKQRTDDPRRKYLP